MRHSALVHSSWPPFALEKTRTRLYPAASPQLHTRPLFPEVSARSHCTFPTLGLRPRGRRAAVLPLLAARAGESCNEQKKKSCFRESEGCGNSYGAKILLVAAFAPFTRYDCGMMRGASRWKDISTADHLALELDAAWEQPKEEGNRRLKEGDHLGAAKLYRDAALLAMGPLEGGAIHAFISALEAWPEGSAQRQIVENVHE